MLAVVACGIYVGRYTPELTNVQVRLQGRGFWEILTFLLNALLFGLVGLQLSPILDSLSGTSGSSLLGDALLIVLAVVVIRIVGVFLDTYVPRSLPAASGSATRTRRGGTRVHLVERDARRRHDRGRAARCRSRSTAARRSPAATSSSSSRSRSCSATLVVQGLSMPLVIRMLRPGGGRQRRRGGGGAGPRARRRGGARAARRAGRRGLGARGHGRAACAACTASGIDRFSARMDPDGDGKIERRSLKYQRLRHELIEAERHAIVELRNAGEISDEVMRRVERDLDLEDSRLDA